MLRLRDTPTQSLNFCARAHARTWDRLVVCKIKCSKIELDDHMHESLAENELNSPLQVEAIPCCRPLPEKMSAEERRWLSCMVARRGGVRLPAPPPDPHDFEHMPLDDRRALLPSRSDL